MVSTMTKATMIGMTTTFLLVVGWKHNWIDEPVGSQTPAPQPPVLHDTPFTKAGQPLKVTATTDVVTEEEAEAAFRPGETLLIKSWSDDFLNNRTVRENSQTLGTYHQRRYSLDQSDSWSEAWVVDGVTRKVILHSPAEGGSSGGTSTMFFDEEGRKHNDNGPAVAFMGSNGMVSSEGYWIHGKRTAEKVYDDETGVEGASRSVAEGTLEPLEEPPSYVAVANKEHVMALRKQHPAP